MPNIRCGRQVVSKLVLGAGVYVAFSGVAAAGQLIYTPVDPSFGGNPLNGTFLLSIAQQSASRNAPGSNLASLDLSGFDASIQQLTTAIDNLNQKVNTGGALSTSGGGSTAAATKALPTGINAEAATILSPGLSGIGAYDPTLPGAK